MARLSRHRTGPISASALRRKTTWATFSGSTTLDADGTYETVDLLLNFKTDGGTTQGITVARTHLRLAVTTAVAATDIFYLGLIRGQNSDVGVDVVGAPDPQSDPYEDWMWWEERVASTMTGAGASFFGPSNNQGYDVKSKRKVEQLQMNYNLVLKRAVTAADDLIIAYSGRILLMLP